MLPGSPVERAADRSVPVPVLTAGGLLFRSFFLFFSPFFLQLQPSTVALHCSSFVASCGDLWNGETGERRACFRTGYSTCADG